MMRLPFSISILAAALALAAILLGSSGGPAARAALDDTPETVVADQVEEWAIGAGLLYWAHNCFAKEFNNFAGLKRRPSAGGPLRVLEEIEDGARCNTYHSLLSSGDGLYFYDASQARIARMPLGEPFTAETLRPIAAGEEPLTGKALVESGAYLYWVHPFGKILRALKDGSGPIETVANTGASPTELMVRGGTVYWTEASGVWTIGTGCGALPCAGEQQQFAPFGSNTMGHGLLYQTVPGIRGRYRIYWVERVAIGPDSLYQIRYRSCNDTSICTLDPPSTFYQSTANWRIGQLLLAAGNLYWTEFDHSVVSSPNGDVKRRSWNASDPGADTLATAQAQVDDALYVAQDQLFFSRRGVGIYSLSLNAAPILRDLKADGIEVTQGIQNLANGVQLVAKKTTYVRAYGLQLSGPNAPNVDVQLVGRRGGIPLPGSPLKATKALRALATGGSYDRARLDDGWYFLLPVEWTTSGTTDLEFVVDPRGNHSDPDRSNNALSVAAVFRDQPPVCVMTVPVRTHSPRPSTTDPNFYTMVDHFRRRWPIPDVWVYRDTSPVEELEVCWYGPLPYPCFGPYELEDGWGITNGIPDRDKVIASLWTRALLSFNPDACDSIGAPVHFMGMVHPDAENGGLLGYASTISNQSWVQLPAHGPVGPGWIAMREGSTMAQELAHNYGREHVNCGQPPDIDPNYPYPPCQIGAVGPASHYGFDTRSLQPIRPDQTADFMSYANPSWVSDYTWSALFGKIKQSFQARILQQPAEESVLVTGLVDSANDRGAFGQVLILPTGSIPPATLASLGIQPAGAANQPLQSTNIRLRLLDAAGTVLADRPLSLQPLDDHAEGSTAAFFSDIFARPSGEVASLQLWLDTTLLDSRLPGTASPEVSLSKPAADEIVGERLTVEWSASDPDPEDRLLFTLQYSPNGGLRWQTLATGLPAVPVSAEPGAPLAGKLVLDDLGSLPGSAGKSGLIRVLASDGYNTGIATSQPFTLRDRRPELVINLPAPDQSFAAGEDLVLMGSGLDAEDGGLADAALSWRLDGAEVGRGGTISVPGLAPGPHGAALIASDSLGNPAVATVDFEIAPLRLPQAALPALDGSCDDAVYAAGAGLLLLPYADGEQGKVRILRSTDHLWLCFFDLPRGMTGGGSRVELSVDADASQDALAKALDLRFVAAEDGSALVQSGDGGGGFVAASPAGLSARIGAAGEGWTAEMRIDKARLGGWDHLAGLAFGHRSVVVADDSYPWPYLAEPGEPRTWAESSLGDQPWLVSLDPPAATEGDAPFALAIEGRGFISGTLAYWAGQPLTTAFIDAEHLSAEITDLQLASAGQVSISAKAPAPSPLTSNTLPFLVHALRPTLTSLSPISVTAGSDAFALTLHGSGFAADAQALWNGMPLATQVQSETQALVQVPAALIAEGQIVGIVLRNQLPQNRHSQRLSFEVLPSTVTPPTAGPTPTSTPPTEPSPTATGSSSATPSPSGTPPSGTPPPSATATATVRPPTEGWRIYAPWVTKRR